MEIVPSYPRLAGNNNKRILKLMVVVAAIAALRLLSPKKEN
jgi:hypothetical protein